MKEMKSFQLLKRDKNENENENDFEIESEMNDEIKIEIETFKDEMIKQHTNE